ncbi:MAG: PhoH family protein [Bacteroidota bacterium]|nr:PhoH family protein [Bacteroidota bacterium]
MNVLNNLVTGKLKNYFPKLKIIPRGDEIKILGEEDQSLRLISLLNIFVKKIALGNEISDHFLDEMFGKNNNEEKKPSELLNETISEANTILYGVSGKPIKARTPNQIKLVKAIEKNDIVFALGPAGTGKTYTAVAVAVKALKSKEIKRIILTRPAVEAGESLGFLPGDLKEKIDPYLRPLYDALDDMIPSEKLKQYLENRTIEVAPLAFMRGRTLDNCFVILDEAQNTTDSQIKMFLTRMGPSAKVIITGDMSQVDLPAKQTSGLLKATRILSKIKGISMVILTVEDVVRHRLVKDIIKAYESDK